MAKLYKVSADTSEKEKVIGGLLTMGQGVWLVIGALISASVLMFFTTFLPATFALVLAIPPGAIFGGVFAFYKKEQLTFMQYLLYKQSFAKSNKLLVNDLNYGNHPDSPDFF